jgi:hypothetical protein
VTLTTPVNCCDNCSTLMKFQLEIQQIDRTCLFKLIWGKGQQISTILPYPELLSQLYQSWRKAYLNFYKTALRARVPKPKNDGKIDLPQDWHHQLVQAEAQLLTEFHRWLRQSELYEIRAKIASEGKNTPISLFLTCSDELARLPWETWELGAEFGCAVAIARSPLKITNPHQHRLKRRRKPRILAILGDDTGLDLTGDRQSLNTLKQVAEIELVTWQPQQPAAEIKQQIQQALTESQGWEVLFFAGHSNETAITGGELAIAPNLALTIQEIAPQLKTAQANGLQFALFNSCSGLSLANSLIDLGLSQVAVMREPIHNQVAQVFLIRFLQALANYQNVQQALITAGEDLKQQQNLTYPSAYLIPSLFCHPDGQLFQIEPWGWQQRLSKWLPTPTEAMIAGTLCFLSILPPVQNFLLDKRVLVQSVYRDVTGQLPTTPAPVALIHIDEQSLRQGGIDRPVPMDRSYLASLIDRLVAADARVIGIDYLFDRTQPENDPILAQSVREAVTQNQTWFIFGAYQQADGQEIGVAPETKIGSPNWTLQGYTDGLPGYLSLIGKSSDCNQACPFAYLLSTVEQVHAQADVPKPNIDSQINLRNSLDSYMTKNQSQELTNGGHPHAPSLRGGERVTRPELPFLTSFVQYFGQQWLRPIQDFSIPPDLVYDRFPAWQLLTQDLNLSGQAVIIGSGGYAEAGLTPGADNFPTPTAIAYWQTRRGLNRGEAPFTGSEFLAYMTHHFLERRLVTPIPELWIILTALLIAKGIKLNLAEKTFASKCWLVWLSGTVAIYGLISWQLYISQAVLIPWLLPSLAIITSLSHRQVD